jgi:hypothetical protein
MDDTRPYALNMVRSVFWTGTCASLASGLALLQCAKSDTGRPLAGVNAPSHWLWGEEGVRANRPSIRHTLVGFLVHHASSIFWAAGHALLRARRTDHHALPGVVADAAAVTAVAALVDLKLVPQRLTPGFERRLSRGSLVYVYLAFGVGLAVGEWMVVRRSGR